MGHSRVDAIVQQAREAVAAAQSSAELERVRVGVLGRQGELTQLLRSLGTLPGPPASAIFRRTRSCIHFVSHHSTGFTGCPATSTVKCR